MLDDIERIWKFKTLSSFESLQNVVTLATATHAKMRTVLQWKRKIFTNNIFFIICFLNSFTVCGLQHIFYGQVFSAQFNQKTWW